MALYITTVEDICSDRNLAKTACTLCSDDLLILLLSDDSTDEWQELQMIAEKKGFHIQKETVTSDSYKSMDAAYCEAIQKIIKTYDSGQTHQKIIFVGKILLPAVIRLYDTLEQNSFHIEARIAGFNPPKRTLFSKAAIEAAYKKQKAKKVPQKPTLELLLDDEGEASKVSITIPEATTGREIQAAGERNLPDTPKRLKEERMSSEKPKASTIGQVAGRESNYNKNAIYQNGQGSMVIAPKKSRKELETSIFRKSEQAEQKGPEYSPEFIEQLLAYEQVVLRIKKYFLEHLQLRQMADKDFFAMLTLIQTSETIEEWVQNMAVELPGIKVVPALSEIEFLEYQRTAQEVTEATYRLGESREVKE